MSDLNPPSPADAPAATPSNGEAAAAERALNAARQAASKALAALTELTKSVREQAATLAERVRPQLASAAGYAKEEPAKTLLASAALGAALVGLYVLLTRSGERHAVALRPSLRAQLGDAAADALDAARDTARETVESLRNSTDALRDKASAAGERLRVPLESATAYAKEDPAKAVLIAAVAGAVAMALITAVASSQRGDD